MSESIELNGLRVSVAGRTLLHPVDWTIPGGSLTVIVGPSGVGKSLLLKILAGVISPDDPVIQWGGEISHCDGRPLEQVGIVFQELALFDELSPVGNVQFALDHRRNRKQPPGRTAAEWLEALRVPKATPTSALSGGQKQRLAIARTLAAEPSMVLYDEPTSGLDAGNSRKVAALIQETQRVHGRTSIVVGHDYETLLPIADQVLLYDAQARTLEPMDSPSSSEIQERMHAMRAGNPTAAPEEESNEAASSGTLNSLWRGAWRFFEQTGDVIVATARLPWDGLPRWPRLKWGLRFVGHYLRLVAGPSAWVYLLLAGLITGFATTYFTFVYFPFSLYTKPLLIEDLLAGIGFGLYRVLVPILATVLIAARCGAAVAADVSAKRYGSQVEALKTLGVRPTAYLLSPIVIAFLIGTPILVWAAFQSARGISLLTFLGIHPEISPQFWANYFSSQLNRDGQALPVGTGWSVLKAAVCGIGTACIAFHLGMRAKKSARDISHSITATVLWTTLFVLIAHAVIALFEFRVPLPRFSP